MKLTDINTWRAATVKRLKEIGLTDGIPPYEKAYTEATFDVVALNAAEGHAKGLGFDHFRLEDNRIWSYYAGIKVRVHCAHSEAAITYSFVAWITEPAGEPKEVLVLKAEAGKGKGSVKLTQVSFDVAGAVMDKGSK